MFNNMLSNCAQILSDTFNIQFDEKQKYQLSLPPSVYELLFRYEYMQFKNSIEQSEYNFADEKMADSPQKRRSVTKQGSEFKSIRGDTLAVVAKNGPAFFDEAQLKSMVELKFEYVHSD